MFELIKSELNKEINYNVIYYRIFVDKYIDFAYTSSNREILKQIVYFGVKYINSLRNIEHLEYETLNQLFNYTKLIKKFISLLTPSELITIFPITKDYDGNKIRM